MYNIANSTMDLLNVTLANHSLVYPNVTDTPLAAGPGIRGSRPSSSSTDVMIGLLSLAYGVVFLLGVINNSLVVAVIYKVPAMRHVTNYFIANLAVADITVCFIVLPITLFTNIFTDWRFGSVMCKVVPYLQGVAVSASVNTLAAVALERYVTIFYPHSSLIQPKVAFGVIIVIWLAPIGIMTPWAMVYTQETRNIRGVNVTLCREAWSSSEARKGFFLGAVFLTCYLIPLIFIIVCYLMIGIKVWRRNVAGIRGSQAEKNIQARKIRIVRMLLVVALLFAFSWLPLYAIRLRLFFGPRPTRQEYNTLRKYIIPVAQWLGSSNSCVNPFIYCYFSEQFRKYMLAIVQSCFCRRTIIKGRPLNGHNNTVVTSL